MKSPRFGSAVFARLAGITALLALVGWMVSGCGPVKARSTGNNNDGGVHPDGWVNPCQGMANQIVCEDNHMIQCGPDGQELSRQDCQTLVCVGGRGCVVCTMGDTYCDGNTVMICDDDLMGYHTGATCDPNQGDFCDPDEGACKNLCEDAAENKANVGCDYLAVDMVNYVDDMYMANRSCFVVIVSNVQPEGTATVTVEDENGQLLDFPGIGTEHQIAPGELAIMAITATGTQCSIEAARPNATTQESGLQPGSVFRIKSTLPVVAYQINPYEAAQKHTTDASLLIPVAALGIQYLTANYPGLFRSSFELPSTISIVAVEDNTSVTVTPSVALQPGGQVPASGQFTVTLNAMEHLQILSAGHEDLTNTLVTADLPVAVWSGDLCTDVPVGMGYCDHIEEQMPPVNSWGAVHVAARPPLRAAEGAYWRVIAAVDGTQVHVQPYSQYDTTLNRGDILEIDEQGSFLIETDSNSPDPDVEPPPILVVNYLKGAEQTALESGTDVWALGNLRGDPAMTLSVPVEQYLNSYIFLSDPSYAFNYVVVVRTDPTQPIHLDCFDPIPETHYEQVSGDYQRALVVLSSESGQPDGTCTSGVHRIWSESPFGIWVYGYYQDTSYGYPGGMNLEQINDVIIVE